MSHKHYLIVPRVAQGPTIVTHNCDAQTPHSQPQDTTYLVKLTSTSLACSKLAH